MLETVLIGAITFLLGIAAAFLLLRKTRDGMRYSIERLSVRVAEGEALLRAEKDKNLWTQDARQQFRDAFKVLATEELEAKASQLKVTAREELTGVVGPLKEEINKLDRHVRDLETKREGAYSSLGTQLEGLHKLQDSLRQQTSTLAQALKAPSIRGRWGEIHLRRLVELSGMEKHVDFAEQESAQAGRPDMVIRLPERGIVPVDSKVPLDAFLKAAEADSEEARKSLLAQHAQAFRARVRELSQRSYWDQFDTTPEVVVMFVPVEASLSAAFQIDRDLFEDAFKNKVLVTSPIALFALLKAIAFGWQQQQVAQNAEEIAVQGKAVYERLAIFAGHLSGVGKSLESSVRKYNEAMGSLDSRVLPAIRKLKELGVGSTEIEPSHHIETQARLSAAADDSKVVRLPESRAD
ncbi:MAG: DNA recombination protein RmuC [Burkholderiales bacterium]